MDTVLVDDEEEDAMLVVAEVEQTEDGAAGTVLDVIGDVWPWVRLVPGATAGGAARLVVQASALSAAPVVVEAQHLGLEAHATIGDAVVSQAFGIVGADVVLDVEVMAAATEAAWMRWAEAQEMWSTFGPGLVGPDGDGRAPEVGEL